jgi:hypothetical protein
MRIIGVTFSLFSAGTKGSRPRDNCCSFKRQCYEDRDHWPISRDMRERNRIPIHDRLGGRVGEHDQLENEASARVPDEGPLDREIEHQYNYRYDPESYP